MIPRGEPDKLEKQIKQTNALVVAMVIVMMLLAIAVVGTGLYLAIHNWG